MLNHEAAPEDTWKWLETATNCKSFSCNSVRHSNFSDVFPPGQQIPLDVTFFPITSSSQNRLDANCLKKEENVPVTVYDCTLLFAAKNVSDGLAPVTQAPISKDRPRPANVNGLFLNDAILPAASPSSSISENEEIFRSDFSSNEQRKILATEKISSNQPIISNSDLSKFLKISQTEKNAKPIPKSSSGEEFSDRKRKIGQEFSDSDAKRLDSSRQSSETNNEKKLFNPDKKGNFSDTVASSNKRSSETVNEAKKTDLISQITPGTSTADREKSPEIDPVPWHYASKVRPLNSDPGKDPVDAAKLEKVLGKIKIAQYDPRLDKRNLASYRNATLAPSTVPKSINLNRNKSQKPKIPLKLQPKNPKDSKNLKTQTMEPKNSFQDPPRRIAHNKVANDVSSTPTSSDFQQSSIDFRLQEPIRLPTVVLIEESLPSATLEDMDIENDLNEIATFVESSRSTDLTESVVQKLLPSGRNVVASTHASSSGGGSAGSSNQEQIENPWANMDSTTFYRTISGQMVPPVSVGVLSGTFQAPSSLSATSESPMASRKALSSPQISLPPAPPPRLPPPPAPPVYKDPRTVSTSMLPKKVLDRAPSSGLNRRLTPPNVENGIRMIPVSIPESVTAANRSSVPRPVAFSAQTNLIKTPEPKFLPVSSRASPGTSLVASLATGSSPCSETVTANQGKFSSGFLLSKFNSKIIGIFLTSQVDAMINSAKQGFFTWNLDAKVPLMKPTEEYIREMLGFVRMQIMHQVQSTLAEFSFLRLDDPNRQGEIMWEDEPKVPLEERNKFFRIRLKSQGSYFSTLRFCDVVIIKIPALHSAPIGAKPTYIFGCVCDDPKSLQSNSNASEIVLMVDVNKKNSFAGARKIFATFIVNLHRFQRQLKGLFSLDDSHPLAMALTSLDASYFSDENQPSLQFMPVALAPYMEKLNKGQREAFHNAIHAVLVDTRPRMCVIRGAPGTGKLRIAVAFLKALLSDQNASHRVLFVVPSETLVKITVSRICESWRFQFSEDPPMSLLYILLGGPTETDNSAIIARSLSKKVNILAEPEKAELVGLINKHQVDERKANDNEARKRIQRQIETLKKELASLKSSVNRSDNFKTAYFEVMKDLNVLVTSISSLYDKANDLQKFYEKHLPSFDCVILYHAGRVCELESLLPLTRIQVKKVIVFGDHMEIPVQCNEIPRIPKGSSGFSKGSSGFSKSSDGSSKSSGGFSKSSGGSSKSSGESSKDVTASIEDFMADRWNGRELARGPLSSTFLARVDRLHNLTKNITELTVQYAVPRDILAFPNAEFYQNLTCDTSVVNQSRNASFHQYRFLDLADKWTAPKSLGENSSDDFTRIVDLFVEIAKIDKGAHSQRYALLTRTEADCRRFRESGLALLSQTVISTVANFQGQHREIVIFYASCDDLVAGECDLERRRICMGLMSATESLFVAGHSMSLKVNKDWEKLIQDARDRKMSTPIFEKSTANDIVREKLLRDEPGRGFTKSRR